MRIILYLLSVTTAFSEQIFLTQPDGSLYGPYDASRAANAPPSRRVPFDASKLPLNDRRGCPRWRWNGSAIVAVPVEERVIAPREYLAKWKEWADARGAYVATQAYVDARPALQAVVLARIAELRAELDAMTRAGEPGDEP